MDSGHVWFFNLYACWWGSPKEYPLGEFLQFSQSAWSTSSPKIREGQSYVRIWLGMKWLKMNKYRIFGMFTFKWIQRASKFEIQLWFQSGKFLKWLQNSEFARGRSEKLIRTHLAVHPNTVTLYIHSTSISYSVRAVNAIKLLRHCKSDYSWPVECQWFDQFECLYFCLIASANGMSL